MGESNRSVLREYLLRLVDGGTEGDILPPVRRLAAEHGMSPVTVLRVVNQLVAEGRIRAEPGRGTFITKRQSASRRMELGWQAAALAPARVEAASVAALDPGNASDGLMLLSNGYLGADLQPRAALQAAAARTTRRGDVWAATPAAGLLQLRAVFAAQVGLDSAEVIVTPGSQSAIATIFRALADPGDAVIVENPTYPGALAAARAAALTPIPTPTDGHGIDPDHLDGVLRRTRARLVYVQTAVNNPTGISLHPTRRRALLDIARHHGAIVIDDDWARHLALDDQLPPPLIADDEHGHVVHISSLAKPAAPSLRIGYLAARGPALTRLHTATITDSLFTTRLLQEIAIELLASPDWPRHLRQLRRTLTTRRDHLLTTLVGHWPDLDVGRITVPHGGHHLWVPTPSGTTSASATALARAAGIVIGDGTTYWANEPTTHHVRMSYGTLTPPELTHATQTLQRVLGSAANE